MKAYRIEIHGSFFNDAGWDSDPVIVPGYFQDLKKAEKIRDALATGEIEAEGWDRHQDPDNTVHIVEVKIND